MSALGPHEPTAPVREHTGASLKSWPLCMSALGPYLNLGPCAGSHWGLIELMGAVCDCIGASLNSWPLCGVALGPL